MRKSPFPFRSGELKFYLHGIRMQSGTGHGKNGYRLMATGFCMSRKKSLERLKMWENRLVLYWSWFYIR